MRLFYNPPESPRTAVRGTSPQRPRPAPEILVRVLTLDSRYAADKADARRLQFASDGRSFAATLGPAGVPHAVAVCDTASGAVTWEAPSGGDATGEPAVSPDLDAICWAEDNADEPF